MSQSLEQPAPPWGEQAWQRLPARGTQPVPAWLPRLPTFPRCHPLCPLPPPQVSNLAESRIPGTGKGCCFPAPLGAQALRVPHYQQPRSPQKSQRGIRPRRAPKHPPPPWRPLPVLGRLDTQTPWLPAAARPGHWDRAAACGARGLAEGPQFPPWAPWRWGCCSGWLPPLLPELSAALVLSFHPTPGLHGAPSQPLPLQAGSPLCRHLL